MQSTSEVRASKEPLLVAAIRKKNVARPPVWLMRQAGRYLSEYRALKEKYSFLELCRSSELALEVSMQPMKRFNPDAAIVFADILTVAECLDFEIEFSPGPKVKNAVDDTTDVSSLRLSDPQQKIPYVMQTIRSLRREMDAMANEGVRNAVLGFGGAPWTLACYLVNQKNYKNFLGTQIFYRENPEACKALLQMLTDAVSEFLCAQVEAGADAVQLFDTWAGNLSLEDYQTFALPYAEQIIENVRKTGAPVTLFVNGGSHLMSALKNCSADCISVDWRTTLESADSMFGSKFALQGNYDPTRLFSSTLNIESEVDSMIRAANRTTGYIANLGHGILPATPPENVGRFISAVKGFSY